MKPFNLIFEAITIAIPVYNEEMKIHELISTLLKLKLYVPFYIFIVDDGSSDNTPEILKKLSSQHENLIIKLHKKNYGRPTARNTLLQNTHTKWLTWLDADDDIHQDKLNYQFLFLENEIMRTKSNKIIVTCNFTWRWKINSKQPLEKKVTPDTNGDQLKKILDATTGAYLWLLFARTETWKSAGRFDENLPRLQDLDFLIRLISSGNSLIKVDNETSLITYNKDYSGRSSPEVQKSWSYITKKHRNLYLNYGLGFLRSCKAMQYHNISRYYYRNKIYHRYISLKLMAYINILLSPHAIALRINNVKSRLKKPTP